MRLNGASKDKSTTKCIEVNKKKQVHHKCVELDEGENHHSSSRELGSMDKLNPPQMCTRGRIIPSLHEDEHLIDRQVQRTGAH